MRCRPARCVPVDVLARAAQRRGIRNMATALRRARPVAGIGIAIACCRAAYAASCEPCCARRVACPLHLANRKRHAPRSMPVPAQADAPARAAQRRGIRNMATALRRARPVAGIGIAIACFRAAYAASCEPCCVRRVACPVHVSQPQATRTSVRPTCHSCTRHKRDGPSSARPIALPLLRRVRRDQYFFSRLIIQVWSLPLSPSVMPRYSSRVDRPCSVSNAAPMPTIKRLRSNSLWPVR